MLEALCDTDVRHLLPRIKVPTLVMHRSGDRAVRVDAGRLLADAIPRAQFVALSGDDHWFWGGDTRPLLEKLAEFAGGPLP